MVPEMSHALQQSMTDAVSATIQFLHEHGIRTESLVAPYTVAWMEPTAQGGGTGREEERHRFIFQNLGFLNSELYQEVFDLPDVAKFFTTASEIFQSHQANTDDFEGDGSGVAERLLSVYFNRVAGLKFEEQALREICLEYVHDLTACSGVIATDLVLHSFEAPENFELTDEITIRKISAEDIDRIGQDLGWRNVAGPNRWIYSNDWICEVRQRSPRNTFEKFNKTHELPEDIAGALSLVSEGRATIWSVGTQWASPFYSYGRQRNINEVPTSAQGSPVILNSAGITFFQEAFRNVRTLQTDNHFKSLQLPYRRLRTAATRRSPEDQLVDHVIGLESLLAGGSGQSEISYRFRLRGASLLSESFGNPRERIKLLSEMYSLRSKVVHGSGTEAAVAKMVLMAEKALKDILLWHLRQAATPHGIRKVTVELDEVMVEGGSEWADRNSSQN